DPTDPLWERYPVYQRSAQRAGAHVGLLVPLLRPEAAIGFINVIRTAPRPFTAKEIALLETFAAQAVIAIETARVFQALQERTQALARSVSELQALSEVGQAVNSSLDLRVVLRTVLAQAVDLSGSSGGIIYTYEAAEDTFQLQIAQGID